MRITRVMTVALTAPLFFAAGLLAGNDADVPASPGRMPEPTLIAAPDDALLQRVARGDHAAFALFYDRVSGPLYSMALKMLGNEHEAQDALLEGMEHLWTKAPSFDSSRAAAFSWTVMLFRSRLIDRMRRKAAQSRALGKITGQAAEPKDDETAINTLARSEDCANVRRVLAALKPEQRELLEQAFFSGMTHPQIAETTGKPLGTVKTTIRRALIELRELLAKEGYEP